MKHILILQNSILHYRKAFYNELSKHYRVTVLHSGRQSVVDEDLYSEIIVKSKKVGPFYFQSKVFREVRLKKYSAIIAMFDLSWVNNILALYFHNKHSKFIWWGAWFTRNELANKARLYLTKKSHSNIFYTYQAKQEFISAGVKEANLFVANNTFDVGKRNKCYLNEDKNSILFVGSLNKRKQNEILITAFFNLLDSLSQNISLIIVGEGEEKENLKELVCNLGIENRVFFKGNIVKPELLLKLYKEAIVAVSFGQAGLAVLQSLGYGVPFITKKNAISGGEKTNIVHGHNGFFCDDDVESLSSYIAKLCLDVDYARSLGENAYNYYSNNCTIQVMAKGFIKAINYK